MNATLNALAAVLLVIGLVMIKRGRVMAHKRVMLTAFGVSVAFLVCYLWYHYLVGSVKFTHPGPVRYVYYAILLSHVLLAFTVPVLAIWTIYLGLRATGCCQEPPGTSFAGTIGRDRRCRAKGQPVAVYRAKHRRLAHWTYPIWLYVSVTGVVVYLMLYHLWPPADL